MEEIKQLLETQKQEIVGTILEAIHVFSDATDERFEKIESDISWMKGNMVTKDFLEVKIADLKGDIVVLVRKEDGKVAALIQELTARNIIPAEIAKRLLSMEPFPQVHL